MTTPNSKKVQVSVVLPAYNEVDYLQPAVEKTSQTLNQFTQSYEVIIAEDGSTDGTAERAEEISQKNRLSGTFTVKNGLEEELHSTTRSSRATAKF